MAYEQKDMSGSMFPNDKKGNDKAPDMTGTVTVGGTRYNLAGWKTKSKDGKAYMSIKVSDFQRKEESDDLPF
jgi:uncharacterized protein (DUF736 family)|tara:strand:+ start:452 stop:667 length:216 start_codon:yes stop_codon:yes gene_type:complete